MLRTMLLNNYMKVPDSIKLIPKFNYTNFNNITTSMSTTSSEEGVSDKEGCDQKCGKAIYRNDYRKWLLLHFGFIN